ncbi:MAG: DUF4258 domain-containing protein [bacterium]|nr:DUF4258 domain-containing protein [bacterium]
MQIEFSDHAELKIRQRKLSRQKILETVERPDLVQLGYSGREKLFKNFGKNHLQVIVKREAGSIVVVTAHWIAKAPKK